MNTELPTAGRSRSRKRPDRPAVDNSHTGFVAAATPLPIQIGKRDSTE